MTIDNNNNLVVSTDGPTGQTKPAFLYRLVGSDFATIVASDPATQGNLSGAGGLTVEPNNSFLVADAVTQKIWRITEVAGAPATLTLLQTIDVQTTLEGVAEDSSGNIFTAGLPTSQMFKIPPGGSFTPLINGAPLNRPDQVVVYTFSTNIIF